MVIVIMLVLIAIASVVIAALSIGSPQTRAVFLLLHVIATVIFIAILDGPLNLWIITLGPGLLVAAVRLIATLIQIGREWKIPGKPQ